MFRMRLNLQILNNSVNKCHIRTKVTLLIFRVENVHHALYGRYADPGLPIISFNCKQLLRKNHNLLGFCHLSLEGTSL